MKKSILLSYIIGLSLFVSSGAWAGNPRCIFINKGELPVYGQGIMSGQAMGPGGPIIRVEGGVTTIIELQSGRQGTCWASCSEGMFKSVVLRNGRHDVRCAISKKGKMKFYIDGVVHQK